MVCVDRRTTDDSSHWAGALLVQVNILLALLGVDLWSSDLYPILFLLPGQPRIGLIDALEVRVRVRSSRSKYLTPICHSNV